MIDFLKIIVINIDIDRLVNHPCLDFRREISETTGEYSNRRIAKYRFCKITVYDNGTVLFSGSIHKMWNDITGVNAPNYKKAKRYKGFNGNQFTLEKIIEVKKHLTELFDCTPDQMIFQNIEFGVNATPKFNPIKYLKGLLYHNSLLFEYRYKGNYAQVPHQRYILKIYYKSHQYGMDYYVLRIELKITKMEELKNVGIRTFADITTQTLNKATLLLLKRFDEVMHYDYTIKNKMLSNVLKQSLKDYSRPHYWIDEVKSRHRDRHKKRLQQITKNHSDNLHLQIRQNIVEKCVIINRVPKPIKCVTINTSTIGLNITHLDKRKCLVTGLNISMQKESSLYLSHTGLKYYYENDLNTYNIIKNKYLSHRWIGCDLDTEIREIAHRIRNNQTMYLPDQKRFFDITL